MKKQKIFHLVEYYENHRNIKDHLFSDKKSAENFIKKNFYMKKKGFIYSSGVNGNFARIRGLILED